MPDVNKYNNVTLLFLFSEWYFIFSSISNDDGWYRCIKYSYRLVKISYQVQYNHYTKDIPMFG